MVPNFPDPDTLTICANGSSNTRDIPPPYDKLPVQTLSFPLTIDTFFTNLKQLAAEMLNAVSQADVRMRQLSEVYEDIFRSHAPDTVLNSLTIDSHCFVRTMSKLVHAPYTITVPQFYQHVGWTTVQRLKDSFDRYKLLYEQTSRTLLPALTRISNSYSFQQAYNQYRTVVNVLICNSLLGVVLTHNGLEPLRYGAIDLIQLSRESSLKNDVEYYLQITPDQVAKYVGLHGFDTGDNYKYVSISLPRYKTMEKEYVHAILEPVLTQKFLKFYIQMFNIQYAGEALT